MISVLIVLLVFVVSIIFCHITAKRRGSNPVFWGVMGGIFGPLAIPFVFISKTKEKK